MKRVIPVVAECVDACFEKWGHWITRACMRTGNTENPAQLQYRLSAGDKSLKMALLEDEGVVCGVVIFQQCGDFLHILSLGGRGIISTAAEWLPWWKAIADLHGFKGLSLRGRRGWDRVLEAHGFHRNGEYLEASWV